MSAPELAGDLHQRRAHVRAEAKGRSAEYEPLESARTLERVGHGDRPAHAVAHHNRGRPGSAALTCATKIFEVGHVVAERGDLGSRAARTSVTPQMECMHRKALGREVLRKITVAGAVILEPVHNQDDAPSRAPRDAKTGRTGRHRRDREAGSHGARHPRPTEEPQAAEQTVHRRRWRRGGRGRGRGVA